MKVLIITNNIKPDSGWGRYSKAVIDQYPSFGVDLLVLAEGDGILPLTSVKVFITNMFTARKMARNADVVHAFDAWPYAIYGYAAVFGTSKKLFINAVGTYAVAPLRDGFKGTLLRRAYRKATKIFSISDFIKNKINEYIQLNTIETVYLGSTQLPVPTSQEIVAMKQTYSIADSSPILLTVGAIKNRKGQLDTLHAVSLLKKTYPDILYLIVGSDKDSGGYVEKIKEDMRQMGLTQNIKIIADVRGDRELACFYAMSDIFLLNSTEDGKHFEGFGLVLLEAAQFGKPVVGSRSGGIPEAMKEGYNGYLSNPFDPESIAEAIRKVMKEYDRLSKNSKLFFQEFDWHRTAEKYISSYTPE